MCLLPQRVLVALVSLHEFGDAVVQAPVGLVAALGFELGGVGVGLVHVAGLHGQEVFLGGLAVSVFDFGDKVHELYGVAAADSVKYTLTVTNKDDSKLKGTCNITVKYEEESNICYGTCK